jgi:transcription elongation factor GreA
MTNEGFLALKQELDRLKTVERPENIRAIEEARAHGDLSENAEYHAAKDRQGLLERRIGELAYKLANAEVIEVDNLAKDRVRFASRVSLENCETGELVAYQLVGPEESDIEKGRISISSPLGKALMGKRPGEEVVLMAPAGKRQYEVVEIL